VLAHVNTSGQHIPLMLDGGDAALGWGRDSNYPYQEGSFFGNIFQTGAPAAYYCNGADFDAGVVPGRLGANQVDSPYVNPQGPTALCAYQCAAAGGAPSPNNDGFSVCYGPAGKSYKHVVTVYRNFVTSTSYKICNKQSGQCLGANGTASGSAVTQGAYASAATQKWTIAQVAAGKYKVVNASTGLALDMAGSKTAVGTSIAQATYTGSATQGWVFASVKDGSGFFQIFPSGTVNSALGIQTGSTIAIEQWGWNEDQKWTIAVAN